MFLAVREPVGVVVAALADFPYAQPGHKLGPILASGCTAVIKPATKTPLSTLYFGELLHRIGFPKGVINFVAGDAKEIGTTLCESPIPAMITMIGSTSGGLRMGTGFYHQRKALLHGAGRKCSRDRGPLCRSGRSGCSCDRK